MPRLAIKLAKKRRANRIKAEQKRRRSNSDTKAVPDLTTALAVSTPAPVIVQGSRTRELRHEEIELLKRTVAKGVTDDEFALFLWVARKHKLDPLTRQLHCVKRWSNKHHEEERPAEGGGTFKVWVGGFQMTIQMGIDGYRSLAGRDHKDFGGCDEPEYVMSENKTPAGKPIPEKATIRLWKKGLEHPVIGVAYWDEFAPADLNDSQAFMWKKMPRHMLAKCAEALAIRKGYPELSDIYTDEEFHQAKEDFTESGRQITQGPVVGTQGAADAVAARKIAEHNAKSPAPAAQDGRGGPQSTTGGTNASPTKIISVSIPGDASEVAYAYGDLDAKIVQEIKERCDGIKLEDKEMYVMPVANVEVLVQRCKFLGYGYQEVSGMPAPKVGDSTPKASPQAPETAATPSGVGQGASKDAPTAVSGTVKQINPNRKAKKPGAKLHYQVVIGEEIYFCYRDTLWPILDQIRPGMEAEVFIKDRVLRGFKRVASRMFDEDGVTPVIQVNEERPAPGKLFA
jgi:phage recombination protein Bet